MKQHYADLSSKKFFAGLCSYMSSGPVVAMVRDRRTGKAYAVFTRQGD